MSFATHWRFLRKRKNKLLYAVTHNTAAEIASSRADASKAKYGSCIMEGGATGLGKETGIVDVVKTDAYADISVFNSSYKSTGLNCQ